MKYRLIYIILLLTVCVSFTSPQPKNEWTIVTLKEYFESKLQAMALAITTAETATEKRFDNTNEWRATYEDLVKQLKDMIILMQGEYVPRTELVSIQRQITELKENQAKYESMKAGGSLVWAYILGAGGMIIGIAAYLQKKGVK